MKTHNNQPKISQSTITNLSVVDIEELFEELTQEEMAGIVGGGAAIHRSTTLSFTFGAAIHA